MRIKEGFMLRSLGGQDIVVAIGEASREFHGMIKLNATGAFLWRELETGRSRKELEQALAGEYQITEEQAAAGVDAFLKALEEAGCILDD